MSHVTKQLAQIVLGNLPRTAPTETLTVAQWLERATAAHLAYRRAIDDRQVVEATAALKEAAEARAQAELLDLEHADPAWTNNGGTHAAGEATHDAFQEPLLRFYVNKLELVRPGDPPIPPETPTPKETTH